MHVLSVGLGVGIGLLYILVSRLTYRLAAGSGDRRFFRIMAGGVVVRLFAAVTLVVLVLLLVSVEARLFVLAFLLTFAGGIVREIRWLHRHPGASTRETE